MPKPHGHGIIDGFDGKDYGIGVNLCLVVLRDRLFFSQHLLPDLEVTEVLSGIEALSGLRFVNQVGWVEAQ